MTTEPLRWYKSSYSSNGGACVEIAANLAATRGTVPVRDSKAPAGPALSVAADAFTAFVEAVKDGSLGAS